MNASLKHGHTRFCNVDNAYINLDTGQDGDKEKIIPWKRVVDSAHFHSVRREGLTNKLASQSRILPFLRGKSHSSDDEIPLFDGTIRFITMLTRAHCCTLPWVSSTQSTPWRPSSLTSLPSRRNLIHAITLMTCIREVSTSNLDWDTEYSEVFVVFLTPSKRMRA
jgi:hypothetical protein